MAVKGNKADKVVSCKKCHEKFPFSQINQHRKKHPRVKKDEAPPEPDVPAVQDVVEGSTPTPVAAQFTVTESERVVEEMPVLDRAPPVAPPVADNPPVSRPTAPPPTPQAPPVLPGVALGPFVDILCGIFDRSVEESVGDPNGPPALPGPITREEKQAIAESMDPLVQKWLPRMGPYALEINAALVLAAVFGPRLLAAKARKNWLEERHRAPPPTANHVAARPPQPDEEDLLRIGDKWVGRIGGQGE